ncbi:pseudouridine synthase [Glomus cerebriforme]|uniref:Pseudouridine synthase n=1 Tax=Glomus cerebriforme TaxID=658196 RepID=A0A397TJ19_9GLOM|nr:pseudouridine synthase [Glomus cerebriforme]
MSQLSGNEKYSNWTKKQLIERLLFYESNQEIPLNSTSQTYAQITSTKKLDKKNEKSISARPLDWSKYSIRHIALKIAYFGWNYHGFASQGNEEVFPSIEGHLFKALLNTKLISDPSDCNFSKCGRTDKGVSGLGQVVTLDVRSNLPKDSPIESNELDYNEYINENIISDKSHINNEQEKIEEVPYVESLNRLLPDDIRVLAWAPVEKDFSARFNCKSRKYKYFFVRGNLDIELMREAANRFLGTHDFRNFCKVDGSKQITNFERTVLEVGIEPLQVKQQDNPLEFYVFNLRGTAFLWHQVRFMMSVLFLIGQKLESPSVVDSLLDITKTPAKPNYEMASEIPLVLYDCEFDNLEWQYGRDYDTVFNAPSRLYNHIYGQWYIHTTKSLVYSTLLYDLGKTSLNQLVPKNHEMKEQNSQTRLLKDFVYSNNIMNSSTKKSTSIILGGGKELRVRNYVNISNKKTCDTAKSKNEKYNAKRIKLDNNE